MRHLPTRQCIQANIPKPRCVFVLSAFSGHALAFFFTVYVNVLISFHSSMAEGVLCLFKTYFSVSPLQSFHMTVISLNAFHLRIVKKNPPKKHHYKNILNFKKTISCMLKCSLQTFAFCISDICISANLYTLIWYLYDNQTNKNLPRRGTLS